MDAQQAIERLYEDESVAGALEDSAAAPLMKWAEAQLERLAQTATDEARFEQDFASLRKLIKRIGRYIDRRTEWTQAEQANELDVIRGDAQWLSAPLTVTTPADYLDKPAVEVVLAMIGTPAAAQTAPTDVPPTDSTPPQPNQAAPALPADPAPDDASSTGLGGLLRRFFNPSPSQPPRSDDE
jgi:hypothetical protein